MLCAAVGTDRPRSHHEGGSSAANSRSDAGSNEPTLEVLMARYVGGDEKAFAALHARTCPRIIALLLTLTGDRSRTEDLCQTAYLKLHRTRARYQLGAPLVPYLIAIARNTFLDDSRQRIRARVRVTRSGTLPDAPALAGSSAPSHHVRDEVNRALAELPEAQREAFVVAFQQDFCSRDTAEELGVSVLAAKLRVHRARHALRKSLASLA